MSKQFVRLAADIAIANSTGKGFTTEQLTYMLKTVADTLKKLVVETGEMVKAESSSPEAKTPADWKASIGKDTITCLICGHSGKILTPHLKSKHETTPKESQIMRQSWPPPSKSGFSETSHRVYLRQAYPFVANLSIDADDSINFHEFVN